MRALQFKSEVGTFKIKRFKACLSLVNSFWFHKTNILVDHSLKNHKNHDSHVLIKSVCVCPTKHLLDSTHWRLLYKKPPPSTMKCFDQDNSSTLWLCAD